MSGTYISKIPVLVVALVIGIVLVTSAVVPLASDYSDAKTFTNEGFNRYTSIDSSSEDTITIVWDHTKPHVITVNNTDVALSNMPNYTSLIFGQVFTFRCINIDVYSSIQLIGHNTASFLEVKSTETNDLTIIANGGTLTATVGETTKTETYDTLYYPADNGSYIMKKPDVAAYLKPDSNVIVANGITTIGSVGMGVYFTGNIEDGYSFSFFNRYADSASVDNVESVYSEQDNYVDLVRLDKITFDLTNGTDTNEATYSYFLVPYEVTADPDNPVAYKNLVKVVPLMAFIMLVVAAAGMVYFKNKD